MARRTLLTPEVHKTIVDNVREGAYDWVAAQAAGIDPRTFYNWMKWGRNGRPSYVQFFQDVSQARAQARAEAEINVRKDNPFNWLRYGPGRERPGEPGWTESHEHTGAEGGPMQIRVVERIVDGSCRGRDHPDESAG